RSSGTQTSSYSSYQKPQPRTQNNNLVDFNTNKQQRTNNYRGGSEVYVIKPQEISESQTVADFLNAGKTIVINMEGLELSPAQRIIDFIGGACYAIGGSLQAISANIFIAAPSSIEVSGDLREEILNETTVSPQLGQY
ncbi:MAG: cell division protein SepF, partial [Lachnospiraceae bacterium]|nr:cell division protein SepF [Lachnospiraceae bacterium]